MRLVLDVVLSLLSSLKAPRGRQVQDAPVGPDRARKGSGRTSALYSGNDHVSPASGPCGASNEICHSALETAMCWRQGFRSGSREAWLEPELASLQAMGPWVCMS